MKVLRCLLAVIVLLLNVEAEAKTASEVFDIASKSIVIVIAYDDKGNLSSFGSGVVLPNGQIATNYHVIATASKIFVLHQGENSPAFPKHTDKERDVCTIAAPSFKAEPVILGQTDALKIGAPVYAIGAPEGLELTFSEGIISGLREVDGGRYIQTTTPISNGSSGGGLFDENGRLIGLMSFFHREGQNLNFALPVEWIKNLLGHGAKRLTLHRTSTIQENVPKKKSHEKTILLTNKDNLASIYFPLVDGAIYTYRCLFSGKESMQKIKLMSLDLPAAPKTYYFIDDADQNTYNPIIGCETFGLGSYFYEKGMLYTIESFQKNDLSKIDYSQRQLLLPACLSEGKTVKLIGRKSDPLITITITGFEDITVPAGTFKNCALIKRHDRWKSGAEYFGYVWLAKNVGVVKWRMGTGRIEELVSYEILK